MTIAYTCPHCGKKLRIPDKFAGQRGTCKGCGKTITAPSPEILPGVDANVFQDIDVDKPPPKHVAVEQESLSEGTAPIPATGWSALSTEQKGQVIGCVGCLIPTVVLVMFCAGIFTSTDQSSSDQRSTSRRASRPSFGPVDNSIEGKIRRTLGNSNRSVRKVETIQITKLPEGNRGLVKWAIDDNLTKGFIILGAKKDVTAILRVFKESGEPIDQVHLRGTFSMVDQFGNSSESVVVKTAYSGAVVNRINFAGFDIENAFQVADVESVIHPEFR